MKSRSTKEIEHGKMLAAGDTELLWGWATPAGRARAMRRANLIAQGAGLGQGSHALEIGCGTGMFTEIFAETGASIVAVDVSDDLIEKAAKRSLPENRVRFVSKAFEKCNEDGPFDAIIGSSVLHHLDLEAAIFKMQEMVKPGGVISFAEPNMLNPQVFMERRFRKYFPYVSPDETAFIRWKLKKILIMAGFEKVEITPFDWMHPAVPPSFMGPVKIIGDILEKLYFLKEFAGSLYIRAFSSLHDR